MSKNCRKDLSKHEVNEIEDLKNSLTSSLEFEDALGLPKVSDKLFKSSLVRDRVSWFDARASVSQTKSVPSSPTKILKIDPLVRTNSVPDISLINPIVLTMTLTELIPLKASRAGFRGWVSRIMGILSKLHKKKELTLSNLIKQEGQINAYFTRIKEIELEMDKVYDDYNVLPEDQGRMADMDESLEFQMGHQNTLSKYQDELSGPVTGQSGSSSISQALSGEQLLAAVSNININPTTTVLDCQEFHGDHSDKHLFEPWLAQFNTVIKANKGWDDAAKLTYLKSKVKSTAKSVIRPIRLADGNFDEAVAALRKRFTNKEFNKDQLFLKLTNARPGHSADYSKTENFISEMRATLLDLKNHYNADLITAGSGGYEYISHLIFFKLPFEIRDAFINKLNKNFPTFDEIYDNIIEIIHNLNRNQRKPESKDFNTSTKCKKQFTQSTDDKTLNQTENFASDASQLKYVYHCKFCGTDGHTTAYCKTYEKLEARQKRCVELGLCGLCTQSSHITDSCFGKSGKLRYSCKICKSLKHVAAMCDKRKIKTEQTNVCLSTCMQSKSTYLLPIIQIQMQGHNGTTCKFNCLLDTASSRSYISQAVSDQLNLNKDLCRNVEYQVKTFLGSGNKSLKETSINVFLPAGRYLVRQILIDKDFNVEMNVRGLAQSISNIKNNNFKLAADYDKPIQGLIGADIISFMDDLGMVKCMYGSVFNVTTGIIPFGDTNHFLYPGQVPIETQNYSSELNFKTIIAEVPCQAPSDLNFCLNPKRSYEDPVAPFFPEASVERNIDSTTVSSNLDSMFSCESIGITEGPDSMSNYDTEKIKEFEKGIEVIDGQVYVELMFHDNVDEVPSNHNISLKICDIVSNKLEAKGELENYNQLFFDQIKEDMIEEFECPPANFKDYNWLPHHPVYKNDATSTFPARPVFNCSLKSDKSKPSLNEASYVGINLMQDMAALIMLFRTNKFALLGDLRKAFLQIKLKLLKDKNRFCFFLRVGDKLRCFRYKTIIFGYNASPFILNYVIKYLANLSPQDECTEMIRNKFFVDNLATTHNNLTILTNLYKTCVTRMDNYHFDLRSCNSNSETLREIMKQDGKYVTHGCEFDKVLGYRYSAVKDTMKLATVVIDSKANTQRKLLSESPKIFDPLGFTTPVTVRSKSLLSSQWSKRSGSGPHWDKVISSEDTKTWAKLAPDLSGLSEVEFPRCALSQDKQTDLLLFCDASKRAYGYVAYAKQDLESNFIISKCKTAPLQEKTLPTLELLSVFLGMQGLKTILQNLKDFSVRSVYVAVDAQVVLSWILSDVGKTKKVFVSNRIKDIKKMRADIFNEFKVDIQFKYVPTAENPADLLTRGLSLESFKQNLEFWLKGPEWIRSEIVKWPTSELKCLNTNSKSIVMATQIEPIPSVPFIFSFERYSSFARLVNVATGVIKVFNKLGYIKNEKMKEFWGSDDYQQCAKTCLLKNMQHECFPKEIEFLKDPRDKPVPELVMNFNLFLDENQLLRSDCRLGKAQYFDKSIIHPVLLPKLHPLTKLIVEDCHFKVKHLGIQSTLNKVRMSGFRLIKPFQTVKSIINPCAMCKKFNVLSYKYPRMTNLPKHRVNMVRPFNHVGVDYTGHIIVKEEVVEKDEGKKKKKKVFIEKKFYLLIFTCLNVRACHVELIPEMSTDHFVLALVRFCNEYGIPSTIYSDNAKAFISGVHVLEKVMASDVYKERFSIYNIKHIRIPLYSPWVGATWERLIRTIKACLKKTIGRAKLDYFRLKTVLSDIQLAINCRPLTYRCAEDNSLEIITPNKFLKPNVESNLILGDPKEILQKSASRKALIQSLDAREEMVSHFRDLWHEEYLLSLRSLYRNLYETDFENKIKVNDIVLIKNPAKGRHHWRLGRVIELIFGSDNKVRSAKILKGDANYRECERKLELHSLKHLFPLELSITHDHVVETEINQDILNLEVEDFTYEPQTNENESNLGLVPDVGDLVGSNDSQEVTNINETQENLGEEDLDSFRFTRDLDPSDLDNFREMTSELVVATTGGQAEQNVPEPIITEPNISSRGRVRRPARRILDDQFEFDHE